MYAKMHSRGIYDYIFHVHVMFIFRRAFHFQHSIIVLYDSNFFSKNTFVVDSLFFFSYLFRHSMAVCRLVLNVNEKSVKFYFDLQTMRQKKYWNKNCELNAKHTAQKAINIRVVRTRMSQLIE